MFGTLPTVSFFFVAPDLQGARYLYLPVVGYALLLTVMVGGWTSLAARARIGCAAQDAAPAVVAELPGVRRN